MLNTSLATDSQIYVINTLNDTDKQVNTAAGILQRDQRLTITMLIPTTVG
jgi:hypothetical protein